MSKSANFRNWLKNKVKMWSGSTDYIHIQKKMNGQFIEIQNKFLAK